MTIDLAFTACEAAETHMIAALVKTLQGTKEERKASLKALKAAQVTFQMALLNLYRVMNAERLGMRP